jgi:hypothetical protein
MIIAAILTAAIINIIFLSLIIRHYQEQAGLCRDAWERQRQTIFFQFARIEELEVEKEILHGVAVRALDVPDVEDYHEVSGLEFATWRN